jgi:hypothetical protein
MSKEMIYDAIYGNEEKEKAENALIEESIINTIMNQDPLGKWFCRSPTYNRKSLENKFVELQLTTPKDASEFIDYALTQIYHSSKDNLKYKFKIIEKKDEEKYQMICLNNIRN